MKKIIGVGFTTLLASIVFSACFAVIDPPNSPPSSAGRITLNIDGLQPEASQPDVKARTLFPDDIGSFAYTVTFSPNAGGPVGESPVIRNFSGLSGEFTETLRTGLWDIDVEARFNGSLVGKTTETVEILYNQTIEKVILIKPVGGANGTLAWSITYDHIDLIDNIELEYAGKGPIYVLFWGHQSNFGINNTAAGVYSASDNSLYPGSYTFKAVLKSPISGDLAGRIEVVHIYPGLTTTLDWVFQVEPVRVAGVMLDTNNLAIDLTTGINNKVLTATVTPPDASDQGLIWSSDNPTVAVVNSSGTVGGRKAGSAVITVTTVDGGYTDTCTVTVTGSSIYHDYNDGTVDMLLWGGEAIMSGQSQTILYLFTTEYGGTLDVDWIVPGTYIEFISDTGNVYLAIIDIYSLWDDGFSQIWPYEPWNGADDPYGNVTGRTGTIAEGRYNGSEWRTEPRLIADIVGLNIKVGGDGSETTLTKVILKNVPKGAVVVGP